MRLLDNLKYLLKLIITCNSSCMNNDSTVIHNPTIDCSCVEEKIILKPYSNKNGIINSKRKT